MRAVTNQDIVWNMPMLKMVDKTGVPILVSAILVYRIVDAKKAALDIDDYRNFVESLGTAALKQVPMSMSMHPCPRRSPRPFRHPCW